MTIFVIIICLFTLIFLHELGHFLVAKKFGIRVDEFGIGIPPRMFGKKIGETIYSINWIPLGGFVKLHGEDQREQDKDSFSSKPIWQRALVVFAGVAAFFVIAFFIFSFNHMVGVLTFVNEEEMHLYKNTEVKITSIAPNSPTAEAGIRVRDTLLKIDDEEIVTASGAMEILSEKEGEIVALALSRGNEKINVKLTPREEFPEGEGPLGFGINLMTYKKEPFHMAIIGGAKATKNMTFLVLGGLYGLLSSLVTGSGVPAGMDVGGPVAIVGHGVDFFSAGYRDFLEFLGIITISLAIFNLLPIPALDGGRLLFLLIEKLKGGPIPEKIEQGLILFFFLLLIGTMFIVTYGDITKMINN